MGKSTDAKAPVVREEPPPPLPPPRYLPKPPGSWQDAVGALKDSALSDDAFRLGAEWREEMNHAGE